MRYKDIRKIKVFANITFADISDTTGVAIFVKEVIGAGVIFLVIVAFVFTAYKAYRKRKKETDEGPLHRARQWPPSLVKAIFGESPCYC